MRLKVVPAARGLGWVRDGIQVCLKQPLGFLSLLGLFFTGAMLVMSLPVIGPFVVVGVMPVVWMAFMLASRRVLSDRRITPGILIEPLKAPQARAPWAKLGLLHVAGVLVVITLGSLVGPGLDDMATAMSTPDQAEAVLSNGDVQMNLLWRALLAVPLSLMFWHTPALVHWSRLPIGKALFFSTVASWRNLGAFALYGAGWAGLMAVAGVAIGLLALLIPVKAFAAMASVLAGMWIMSAFYASLYFSVVDCFEPSTPLADEAEEPPAEPPSA